MSNRQEQENVVDIRPVRLTELTEAPKIISGSIHRVNFSDHRGYEDPSELVLVDPTFEDSSGRLRELASDPNTAPLFFHKDNPRNRVLAASRWVTLDQLETKLRQLDPNGSININIIPQKSELSSEAQE